MTSNPFTNGPWLRCYCVEGQFVGGSRGLIGTCLLYENEVFSLRPLLYSTQEYSSWYDEQMKQGCILVEMARIKNVYGREVCI